MAGILEKMSSADTIQHMPNVQPENAYQIKAIQNQIALVNARAFGFGIITVQGMVKVLTAPFLAMIQNFVQLSETISTISVGQEEGRKQRLVQARAFWSRSLPIWTNCIRIVLSGSYHSKLLYHCFFPRFTWCV